MPVEVTPVANLPVSSQVSSSGAVPSSSRYLRDQNLRGTDLRGTDLRHANLQGVDLRGADLREADLRGAVLCDADLSGARLQRSILSDANLRGARLHGVDLRNAILTNAILWDANLSGAILQRTNLWNANLSGAILCGADLQETILNHANLRDADLSRVNLWGGNLQQANLSNANLSNVNLCGVDLSAAKAWDANFSDTNLEEAVVENTCFGRNLGISQDLKQTLQKQGALFSYAAKEESFAGVYSVIQHTSVTRLTHSSDCHLPTSETDSVHSSAIHDSDNALVGSPGQAVVLLPEQTSPAGRADNDIRQDTAQSKRTADAQLDRSLDSLAGDMTQIQTSVSLQSAAASKPTTEAPTSGFESEVAPPTKVETMAPISESTYVSPISKTAEAIRKRRQRMQSRPEES
jgi:uncharacterized protein YjbI with pentapeptide repeats